MSAKPTEAQIRIVVAAMDLLIAKQADNMREAMKVKDVLMWVLGDESGFATFAAARIVEVEQGQDQESHSE